VPDVETTERLDDGDAEGYNVGDTEVPTVGNTGGVDVWSDVDLDFGLSVRLNDGDAEG